MTYIDKVKSMYINLPNKYRDTIEYKIFNSVKLVRRKLPEIMCPAMIFNVPFYCYTDGNLTCTKCWNQEYKGEEIKENIYDL